MSGVQLKLPQQEKSRMDSIANDIIYAEQKWFLFEEAKKMKKWCD